MDYKSTKLRLLCPWDFPGKNTGMGCHFLLQGIFPAKDSNPHFLHWQATSLPLSHQGSPYVNTVEVGLPLLYAVIQRRRLLSKLSLSHNNVAFEMVLKREASMEEDSGVWCCFPGGSVGKESACQCSRCKRCGFSPWAGKIPWRRKWQPIPAFLPGKSHGQRSLPGYSSWGFKSRTRLTPITGPTGLLI